MIPELVKEYEFNPRVLGLFVNPFYFARKGIYQYFYKHSMYVTGKVLDVGCGLKPYQSFFPVADYTGMELAGSPRAADCYYDGITFPFKDGEFELVLVTQVLEHISNPDDVLAEIYRVLKNRGKLIMTVPFIWDEHEQPHDYRRYTSFGIKHLLEQNGFRILHQEKSMKDIRVIFQMINAYLYKKLWGENIYLNGIVMQCFIAPVNIIGEVLGRILPENEDLYLDNIILAIKEVVHE